MTWLIPLYSIAVIYPSWELTRYILEWKKVYGEFPPGGSLFGQAHWEIVFIWSTYLMGVCLVSALLERADKAKFRKDT